MIEDFHIKLQLLIFRSVKTLKKNRKSGYEVLIGIRCRFQNCPCFSSSIDVFLHIFFKKYVPLKNMKIVIFSKTKSEIK